MPCRSRGASRSPGGGRGNIFSWHKNLLQSKASPGTGLSEMAQSWLGTLLEEQKLCCSYGITATLKTKAAKVQHLFSLAGSLPCQTGASPSTGRRRGHKTTSGTITTSEPQWRRLLPSRNTSQHGRCCSRTAPGTR